ncbi:AAA domain-containing protein [Acinetobacter baumannii]|uniref:AAA family ATPase n=2 Tax=Acinetobacter baumannii TaxID=470 RepID=A0A432AK37_ACIBA|nr:AAA domain-containing protein [Acinetobacter baumannii]AMQ95811.1 ATP-dependent RecD-like DNA helicase [Acinetobacter baumannii]ASS85508.1 ATP-dependent RecD-like DNA helicase [Acinetobacter baumannii]EHU3061883.1 AAA family ATPase [Acinetobacter baumannii]ENW32812.1 hypothetical protein F921_03828 [Acinetobacter baumannii NIPH 527]KMV08939.1 type III restriction enzyme, res subunit [Acinetobacter baumannii]
MSLIIKTQANGLHQHETKAIADIRDAFSIEDEMRRVSPWYGYAGYTLVDPISKKEGEFDLILVTNSVLIVIELKDWNGKSIKSANGNWYMDDRDMGVSPVSTTRLKQYILVNKLKTLKDKFTANPGFVPRVYFFVVMCGKVNFSSLPDDEQKHVISLDKFLKFANKNSFNKEFTPHPNAQHLYKDFDLIDKIFVQKSTLPKKIIVQKYKQDDELLSHPKKLYTEYEATSTISRSDKAIIRQWMFSNFQELSIQSPKMRAALLNHERVISAEFKQSSHLYNTALVPLIMPDEDQITQQYNELVEYRQSHLRFNDFITTISPNLSDDDKLNLIQILLSKFSAMHNLGISHGDINSHCIWISPQKDVAISHFLTSDAKNITNNIRDLQPTLSFVADGTQSEIANVQAFKKDVYMLAVIVWHLWLNIRLTPKALNNICVNSDHWLADLVKRAINLEIEDAGQLLREFNAKRPVQVVEFIADTSFLNEYITAERLSRLYPEDDEIYEDDDNDVILYRSGDLCVKEWSNVHVNELSSSDILKYQHFFERIKEANSQNLSYLPSIERFGISTKSRSLFLVSKFVEGITVDQIETTKESRLLLAANLIEAIIHLHKLGLPIGRICHGSVLFNLDDNSFIFNDIIDINEYLDHESAYYPSHIDNPTSEQCQNYAIMRLVCEILGFDIGNDSSEFKWVSDAVNIELEESEYPLGDLNRLLESIETEQVHGDTPTIRIPVPDKFSELQIFADNKRIYVGLEKGRNASDIVVKMQGVGGAIQFILDPISKTIRFVTGVRESDVVPHYVIDQAVLEINVALDIKHSVGRPEYTEFSQFLFKLDEFSTAVNDVLQEQSNDQDESIDVCNNLISSDALIVDEQLLSNEKQPLVESSSKFTDIDSLSDEAQKLAALNIDTKKLWKAILETETEALPYIILSQPLHLVDSKIYIARYEDDNDVLDKFPKDSLISLIHKTVDFNGEDREFRVGDIDIQNSLAGELRVKGVKHADKIKVGEVLYLRTKADKSSFLKRKNALEQILRRQSDIPNLVEYFEPNSEINPIHYDITVTDRDFERYDQYDQQGEVIVSLNNLQREAFRKLINYGPVSILQGPPGTGKTEFIAAFVHFLFEKQNVNNVLMVSQSHEAVNTAAERIRNHSHRLNTPLEIVRFSNRENAVSNNLKDVFSDSIISTHRNLFLTEMEDRVLSLSQSIGVDRDYLACALFLKVHLFGHLSRMWVSTESEDNKLISKAEWNNLSTKLIERLKDYSKELHTALLGWNSRQVLDRENQIWEMLDEVFEVQGKAVNNAKALVQIAFDYDQLIDSPNANYETYLSKTRQFICGTCVGIGHHSIDIANQSFDWVIIDESARSISSELAIAMQSAKRILLVGDHKQLPPLYSPEHAKALGRKLGFTKNRIEVNLKSDFERLFKSPYGKAVQGKLLVQYRMAPAIGEMVSACFYDKELVTGVIEPLGKPYQEKMVRVVPNIYQHCSVQELRSTVTWVDTSDKFSDGVGTTFFNKHEARKIIGLLEKIYADEELLKELRERSKPNEPPIGIICMYGEQKRYLRKQFNSKSWNEDFRSLVKIDTVDSYQGKENRIIILSVTRNSPDNKIGFMNVPNRINVALSRAMDRLVIFGASRLWNMPKHQESPLGEVFNYIKEHSSDRTSYQYIADRNAESKLNANIKTNTGRGISHE